MKLYKVLKVLYKFGQFLYENMDKSSEIYDEATFLKELADYLVGLVDEQPKHM